MKMKMKFKNFFPPVSYPVIFFAGTIMIGTVCLHSPFCHNNILISWVDSLFTAVSAVCVTGLTVTDTGTSFSQAGQTVILLLIQTGGLGIMSFTTLAFFLLKKNISLADKVVVGQTILHNSRFNLGKFLIQIVIFTFCIEGAGALLLYGFSSNSFSPFSAVFHSISAFCNAGFSLNADSLMAFKDNWSVNITIMVLIILGGLGFAVLVELKSYIFSMIKGQKTKQKLSWHLKIVVGTSLFLILAGWFLIYVAEFIAFKEYLPFQDAVLTSLFQSVTSRTAGFNTLDVVHMTNVSIVFIIILMFVGGAPGSCAGGVKVTTFRLMWVFFLAQLRGRHQIVLGKYAVSKESFNKAIVLLFFSIAFIFISVILMDFTEGGAIPHTQLRGQFLEILFEAVSAFGTVGLSLGLTAKLSVPGKFIIMTLMFIGRLGPLLLLSAVQSLQTTVLYSKMEENIVIG
ncbi:MAG: potassium transporter TrkG [Thermodesulfobacteriota bacterium]|nr:potassium transporter TrkG [Thermodesulfobacteriota bacterium]